MLRVHSNTNMEEFSDYGDYDDMLFDKDDPDFVVPAGSNPIFLGVHHKNMSIASVHPAELHSNHSSLTTLSHSLEDISGRVWSNNSPHNTIHPHHNLHPEHVLTIEELRLQMSSCFTCGVSWSDSHVSLDCKECGDYAMERPCPSCEGVCGAVWKRDLTMSHASSKARWQGECALEKKSETTATQELSVKMEKLSANS